MTPTAVATQTIPVEIEEEISNYEREAQRFLRGEVHPEVFRRFRLQHGIYGQRQDGVQMVRIKIPFGGMNAAQLRRLVGETKEPRQAAALQIQWNCCIPGKSAKNQRKRAVPKDGP